jgi:UDP-N-acetylmuramoyl-L-alanyl-D-glutamate--2,6-diaminopimelate ligase
VKPTVTLAQLIARLPRAHTEADPSRLAAIAATGISHDSRQITSGDVFVCLRGQAFDGHQYALQALEKGAVAVVAQRGGLEEATVTLPADALVISVKDTRKALALLACALYGAPSHTMTIIGVTGTNGKTTTTRMIASILRAAGRKVGTIGTLGAELDGIELPSEHTTPEADQLQGLLAEMRDRGAQAVVMEVSSHALAQWRTDGIAFNVGVFTNLTQDHLDFHGTMDAYFEAKSRLFAEYPVLYPRPDKAMFASVINVEAWDGKLMVTLARGDILTYTPTQGPANLHAHDVRLTPDSVQFTLDYDNGVTQWQHPFVLPVGGAFQVGNALAAIGAGLKLGVKIETIAQGLAQLPSVPGRFESVPNTRGFSVVVDYAHTPDGLENVLRSARELHPARLLCVFGCGGNRDRAKRPLMGRLAATLADIAIVTSDNPRHEEPQAIIAEILTGMDKTADPTLTAEIHVEADRRKAIELAVSLARADDLIVIAGKGHEDYQIIGDTKHHFDDREIARELTSPPSPLLAAPSSPEEGRRES